MPYVILSSVSIVCFINIQLTLLIIDLKYQIYKVQMTTLRIFDEFPESFDEITAEIRHKKRLALEPFIYDILKTKYGRTLDAWWKKYTIPNHTQSDKTIVIIERRIHPNLWFLIRNFCYFCQGWSVLFVCSKTNIRYIQEILEHNRNNCMFMVAFSDSPDREKAIQEYNTLLKDANFYNTLPSENNLFIQTDTYLRKPIPNEILQYDYVASPFTWDNTSAGGGLSFRKRSAMIKICSQPNNAFETEDTFICNGVKENEMKMPEFMEGIQYFVESCLYEDPVGVHQWWTFFHPGMEYAEDILNSLLILEIEE